MSFMNVLENEVLNSLLGAGSSLLSSPLMLGLSTTTPTDAGGGITEPVGGSYARVSISNDGANWGAASGGQKTNAATFTFPAATANWGLITHWVLFETGVPQIWGELDDGAGIPLPRQVNNGDQFRFLSSQLRITLD